VLCSISRGSKELPYTDTTCRTILISQPEQCTSCIETGNIYSQLVYTQLLILQCGCEGNKKCGSRNSSREANIDGIETRMVRGYWGLWETVGQRSPMHISDQQLLRLI
jgi:hypothetical protein